jgi:hypothetical protein
MSEEEKQNAVLRHNTTIDAFLEDATHEHMVGCQNELRG